MIHQEIGIRNGRIAMRDLPVPDNLKVAWVTLLCLGSFSTHLPPFPLLSPSAPSNALPHARIYTDAFGMLRFLAVAFFLISPCLPSPLPPLPPFRKADTARRFPSALLPFAFVMPSPHLLPSLCSPSQAARKSLHKGRGPSQAVTFYLRGGRITSSRSRPVVEGS